jgi:16S rRNA (uracil1498-N3)-methyltransferase
MRRFVVRPEAIGGGWVRFDPAETHHLRHVLRLGPGAVVAVSDGVGCVHTVRLETLGPAGALGAILESATGGHESPCAVTLAQAVLKGDRMRWLVQKATELGVARIVPLRTARVVAHPSAAGAVRWTRIAREATKQCGRSVAPAVEPVRPLEALLAEVPEHDVTWLAWEGGGVPVAVAARGAAPGTRRVLLVVGPEGGWTPAEVEQAVTAGARLVGLGPRTLRAESASLAMVVLCQHLFGDLGRPDGSAGEAGSGEASP